MECRFAVPKGLLGQSYSNPLDLPRRQGEQPSDTDSWVQWELPDQNLLSTGIQLCNFRNLRTEAPTYAPVVGTPQQASRGACKDMILTNLLLEARLDLH